MAQTRDAEEILAQEFFKTRCLILDLAAALDRIDRAEGGDSLGEDPQMELLRGGLELLRQAGPGRAEKVQLHFSDEYQPGWNQ